MPQQRLLYWVAALFAASAVLHAGVFLVQDGGWIGPVSWRKPIEFAASFAIATATLAWVLGYLPRRDRLAWTIAGTWAVATVLETSLITAQVWRGVPSHFNTATALDGAIFDVMGVLIVIVALDVVAVTAWSLVELRAPAGLRLAIIAGLAFLLAGQALGFTLLAEGMRQAAQGLVTSPVTVGNAGALTVPHAIALHGFQAIPLLGWLAVRAFRSAAARRAAVLAGAALYAAVVIIAFTRASAGDAPLG